MISDGIKNKIFDLLNYFLLSLFVIICIYPFYYVFIYSISNPQTVVRGIFLLPSGLNLDTYKTVLSLKNMANSFFVSLARTVSGTAITLFCCSLFAYVLAKEKMLFRKIVYRALIITMYINAGLIPWYITMKILRLDDNFLLYILPSAVSGFYVILMKTYLEQLPASLEESAMIDGAGYLKIYGSVVLPLCKPILATIAVFSAVGQWNSWMDNYFLVYNEHLKTMQLTLYEYLSSANAFATMSAADITRSAKAVRITPEAIKMCTTMIVTIPILLVYPLLQKYFVKGIMLGAIKG